MTRPSIIDVKQTPMIGPRVAELRRRARLAVAADVEAGACRFDPSSRAAALLIAQARLPADVFSHDPRSTRRALAGAIRRERALGRSGHWSYDLNRHIALLQAWRAAGDRTSCTGL